jgi:hypothetical protein
VNTKLLHAENDLLEKNVREEKAAKVIHELQSALIKSQGDR